MYKISLRDEKLLFFQKYDRLLTISLEYNPSLGNCEIDAMIKVLQDYKIQQITSLEFEGK